MRFSTQVLALLSAATVVHAALSPTWVSCYQWPSEEGNYQGVVDRATCIDLCTASGDRYMIRYGPEDRPQTCYCSSADPIKNLWSISGTRNTDSPPHCMDNEYNVYRLMNAYDAIACYSTFTDAAGEGSATDFQISSYNECWDGCLPYTYAAIYMGSQNQFWCRCLGPNPTLAGLTSCPNSQIRNVATVYKRTTVPQASAITRRRLPVQSRKERCPRGFTPCGLGSDDNEGDFECIDTASELESCGGCMKGAVDNTTVPLGTDCTTIPGIAFGGVTCQDGSCVATACETGFKLVGNKCIGRA